ncbi:MAG: hypothetical protein HY742_01830 [Deltaproteobacteria bacterium]|nr:hypothetical protein [Deltaproteobacteria bacterium]
MRKFIVFCQLVVLCIVVVKIAAFAGLLQTKDVLSYLPLTVNRAMAESPAKAVHSAPIKDPKDPVADSLRPQRDLAASLQARKMELDSRENALKTEEQKLLALKKEILEKIDLLRGLEEKLNVAIEANKSMESKRYKDLAKVYESTLPAKAGPMLEKLDVATAAGITMNMKRDKAGAIWGYLSPQKAVEITREITKSTKQAPVE